MSFELKPEPSKPLKRSFYKRGNRVLHHPKNCSMNKITWEEYSKKIYDYCKENNTSLENIKFDCNTSHWREYIFQEEAYKEAYAEYKQNLAEYRDWEEEFKEEILKEKRRIHNEKVEALKHKQESVLDRYKFLENQMENLLKESPDYEHVNEEDSP